MPDLIDHRYPLGLVGDIVLDKDRLTTGRFDRSGHSLTLGVLQVGQDDGGTGRSQPLTASTANAAGAAGNKGDFS